MLQIGVWDERRGAPTPLPTPQAARYAEGVRRFDFDSGLAPYDLAACAAWHDLACFIDPLLLKRLMPVSARLRVPSRQRVCDILQLVNHIQQETLSKAGLAACPTPFVPCITLQGGGEISVMAEALDPELMHPKTEAERRLVAQLQVRWCSSRRGGLCCRAATASVHAPWHCWQVRTSVWPVPTGRPNAAANPQEGHARQQQRRAEERSAAAAMEADGPGSEAAGSSEQAPSTAGAAAAAGPGASGRDETRWGRCTYTRLPRLVKPPGASGAALTALNLDKTAALEAAAAAAGDPSGKALLGELQFAFIAFVFGQSLEGGAAEGLVMRETSWGCTLV